MGRRRHGHGDRGPLCITLAGIPLLIAAAGVIRGCANAERWRLREVLAAPIHGGYRAVRQPGILGQVRTRWSDPATWRDFVYLFALFPFLWALDFAVVVVWLVLLAGITVPVWYRYVTETFNNGQSAHGLQFGYFPNGPRLRLVGLVRRQPAPGADRGRDLPVLFLLFNYVLVGTARLHARIGERAAARTGRPDGRSKEVLTRPGPLGPLHPGPNPTAQLHSQPVHRERRRALTHGD